MSLSVFSWFFTKIDLLLTWKKNLIYLMIIIAWNTHTSSIKHFFVLLRFKVSPLRLEKMVWPYPIFVFLKFLEFSHIHTSNLEFHCSKIWSVVSPLFISGMESIVFFQTFKPLDNVCFICLITIITTTRNCVHSQKPSSSIFHYIIIKKSTFSKLSYLTTNWIVFWTSKVYCLRLWVAMVMSYMSGTVIFMVTWYGSWPWLRVCSSNPHGDLTKNRLKSLLLTLNTLTCSSYVRVLVIYKDPNLSIKLLESLLTTL